jgi:hypothetical protein
MKEAGMDWGFLLWMAMAVAGAAAIFGGVVLYRSASTAGARAAGAALAAGGVVLVAIAIFTLPASSSTS